MFLIGCSDESYKEQDLRSLKMKLDNLSIFTSSIFRGKKKIAIVGNGGITKEDDEVIYNSDCVIRFNNYATREGITKTKDPNTCDILFTTFDLHSPKAKPKDVVIGIPFPFHSTRIRNLSTKWYQDSRWWMVNPYWNEIMSEELKCNSKGMGYQHPFPSIGFTCLWHLNRMKINLPIYICGFNFYFDWNTKLCQGCKFGQERYPSHFNHNYCREVEWIVKNLLGKININFGEGTKKILEYASTQIK